MKEVLIKLKEAYLVFITTKEAKNGYGCLGLCFVSYKYLSTDEDELFQNLLKKYINTRKVFYTYQGEKMKCKSQFLWMPKNSQARINWLDRQIAKFS
jgi:hypothetical protein